MKIQNEEPLTCKNDNRGQIIYKENEGNVEICHQQQWKTFATSKSNALMLFFYISSDIAFIILDNFLFIFHFSKSFKTTLLVLLCIKNMYFFSNKKSLPKF